jgi:hypothetical protein
MPDRFQWHRDESYVTLSSDVGDDMEKPYAAAKLLWELVYRDLKPYFIDELNLIDAVDEVIRRIRKETEENLP